MKSFQVLVFAYAFHLICGIVYEPEPEADNEIGKVFLGSFLSCFTLKEPQIQQMLGLILQKLVTAVCPTCKDRVSQRMGYARMAEEGFS